MNKKKIAIYPFHKEVIEFVKYINKNSQTYYVNEIVSPKSFGLSKNDGAKIYNKPEIGMVVTDNLISAIKKSDILLVVDYPANEEFRQVMINK